MNVHKKRMLEKHSHEDSWRNGNPNKITQGFDLQLNTDLPGTIQAKD